MTLCGQAAGSPQAALSSYGPQGLLWGPSRHISVTLALLGGGQWGMWCRGLQQGKPGEAEPQEHYRTP